MAQTLNFGRAVRQVILNGLLLPDGYAELNTFAGELYPVVEGLLGRTQSDGRHAHPAIIQCTHSLGMAFVLSAAQQVSRRHADAL